MNTEDTANHIVSYPEVKEPQKQIVEKHASPRKASVLSFNPDGSLCIPADLKEKLSQKSIRSSVPRPKSIREATPDASSGAEEECSTPGSSSKENHTPESSRKRRKNAAPRSTGKAPRVRIRKDRKPPCPVVIPEEGCCHFCYTKDSSRDLGELRERDGILGHHSCLVS